MPFRPRASRYWHYDFQIGGRRFHGSCGTEDFETAKAVEAEARVRARAALTSAPPGIFTVSEALGTYYADVAAHQPSHRVTLSQGKQLLSIIDGKTSLPDLTAAQVQRFVTLRRAQVANGTVNRALQLLGRAMRHMGRVHGATLPAIDLRAMETPEAEERVRELSREEQERLFGKLRPDLHPLVTMALATGLRLAELASLQWADVDMDTGRMRFRQKGGKTRHFPINAELRAVLSAMPRADALPHSRYVLTYVNQRLRDQPRHRITPSGGGIMAAFRQAVQDAEIADFHFHDLRHTFASRMLRQTGNLKLVSRLLGHSKVETTTRYAHVLDDDMRAALDGYSVMRVPKSVPKQKDKALK